MATYFPQTEEELQEIYGVSSAKVEKYANLLKVPKLGDIKIRMHRPLQGDPKEVTLVKKASGWYAHISCDYPRLL